MLSELKILNNLKYNHYLIIFINKLLIVFELKYSRKDSSIFRTFNINNRNPYSSYSKVGLSACR